MGADGARAGGSRFAMRGDMANTNLQDPRTFAIIGAAMEVHRVLGCGFLEELFRDALRIEFGIRKIPFQREVPCAIEYKGYPLRGTLRIDFICFESVIVEVKARSAVGPADQAQILHYLAASRCPHGLLLNFGGARLEYRRFVLSRRDARSRS
jgi:GxxExxY protein